jgi:tRNA (guanine-N7-)-methyltransferase
MEILSNFNQLKNIQADAVEVLTEHIENDSLSRFQLFFPDPWHKKKHHKRRLVNCDFLDILSQKIKQNGEIHMATDWEHYAIQMMDNLKSHPHFKNTQSDPIYSPRPNYRPMTKFERRGERLGHGVWDLIFTNEKT